MNILKRSALRFVFFFILVLLLNIVFVLAAMAYVNSQQYPPDTSETIASEITLSDGSYHVSPKAKRLISQEKLWVMIIDKNTGREIFNINKPQQIGTHFNYADVVRFSRFYLHDYPVFTRIKDDENAIYIVAFPKDSIIRYSYNFLESHRYRFIPILALGIISINVLLCLFLYIYSVTFLNRNIRPIINAIGKLPSGLNTQVNSVKELDRLALAVNSANQQLRENEEFKENWISGIAHDIKTPLSVIVSNTSLAIEKTDNENLLKHLNPTLVESHYIQNLLNDLNIFARLTNGNLELKKEIVTIIPFFKEIIIQIVNQDVWEEFQFEFDAESNLSGKKMYVEKALISRVIHNLIYNSVLHNSHGCTIKIELKSYSDDNFKITVQDNGVGTSLEKLKNINKIEEFTFDISGVRRSGMGLKISKQIIDLHNGDMIIKSEQGRYFKADIILPIAFTSGSDNPL